MTRPGQTCRQCGAPDILHCRTVRSCAYLRLRERFALSRLRPEYLRAIMRQALRPEGKP